MGQDGVPISLGSPVGAEAVTTLVLVISPSFSFSFFSSLLLLLCA